MSLPNNRLFDIVGIGRNSWDRLAVVRGYPKPDTKVEVESLDIQPGGQVATAMVTAVRLGARTRYLGKFGDDAGGRAVRGALSREGIDLSESRVIPGVSNQSAFIVVDQQKKTRNVFGHVDSRLRLSTDDFSYEAVTSGKILYIGGRNPSEVLEFARMGHNAGCLVAIDTDSATEGITDLLKYADVIICPKHFLTEMTQEKDVKKGLKELSQVGASFVCVTQGPQGAAAIFQREFVEEPAYSVDVVDTTGAGDVFHGAVLVGLLEGLAIREILQLANAAAAMKCQRIGGQRGIPEREDIKHFLAARHTLKS